MAALPAAGAAAVSELYPPRARGGLDPRRPGELADRLARFRRAYLAQPDCRAIGSLQILDLERVRARLGRRWPELLHKVLLNVEGCIAHRLGPDELYLVVDEVTVWILALGERRADVDRRGRLIAADVTERLLGVLPGGTAVGVRTLLFDFDRGLRGVAGLAGLRERVEGEARQLAEAEERLFAEHAPRMVALYRPILSLEPPAVVGYRALVRLASSADALEPLETIAADGSQGVLDAAVDTWLAGRVAHELGRAPGVGEPARLLLPVHHATLADPTLRGRWLGALAGRAAAERLAVELVDPPPGTPPERIGELAARLGGHDGRLVVRCPPDADAVDELAGAGVAAASLDGAGLDPADPGTMPRLRAVALACRERGLRSLLVRVGSAALAEQARAAGIDELAGDACLPPLRSPGPVVGLERG